MQHKQAVARHLPPPLPTPPGPWWLPSRRGSRNGKTKTKSLRAHLPACTKPCSTHLQLLHVAQRGVADGLQREDGVGLFDAHPNLLDPCAGLGGWAGRWVMGWVLSGC